MIINLKEVISVYSELSKNVMGTLDYVFSKHNLSDDVKDSVLTKTVSELLELSVKAVLEAEVNKAKIDSEIENIKLIKAQTEVKQYEVDFILPEQKAKLLAEIDLIKAQDLELGLSGAKDRALKDAQISKLWVESVFTQAQKDELLLNGANDRLVKYSQVLKLQEETALLHTQDYEMTQNGIKDRDMKKAQTELYARQKDGFDDNKNQKLFEAQMNAWALMFSSGLLTKADGTTAVPSIVTSDQASVLYNILKPSTP